jgi:hypothetical protein
LRYGLTIEGSSDVRNSRNIVISVVLLLAVSGCGRGGKVDVNSDSDAFKDGQYRMTVGGLNAAPKFQGFLQGLSPADRVKYINKSAEGGPTKAYPLKQVYEHFSSDPNPEVASAAKEALEKCPANAEEYEKLRKEELEALKQ